VVVTEEDEKRFQSLLEFYRPASDQLRHSGIALTAAYYIDRPRRATSGIGPLLETKRKGKKIIEFKDGPLEAGTGSAATRRTVT
jgi:hypothetical protein